MSERPDPPPLRHDPSSRLQATRGPLLAGLVAEGRHRRGLALALLTVAATLAAAVWLITAPAPEPALAVRVDDDVIVLRLNDPEASSESMTAELREAGLRGAVVVVPVTPELVGSWVLMAETAGLEPRSGCLEREAADRPVIRLHTIERDGPVLRVPAHVARESSGAFIFVAGRAARDGEQPARGDRLPIDELPADLRAIIAPPDPPASCP